MSHHKPKNAKPFKFKKYQNDVPEFKDAEPDIDKSDLIEYLRQLPTPMTLAECHQDDFEIYDTGGPDSTWVCVRGRCWKVG